MNLKRIALTVLAVFLFSTVAFADDAAPAAKLAAQSFKLRFKQAENAAMVIKPLVSADGSVSIQANMLVVTDRAENMKAIAAAIEQFDSPAKAFSIELKIVSASRSNAPPAVPEDLKEISAKLSGVFRFNAFEKLGEIRADGREGDSIVVQPSAGYRAEFKFGEYDPVSDSVRLNDFALAKTGADQQLVSLLRTSLNLKVGQTVVLGASRMPDSQRVLMLVLSAKRGR
jgi:hypothetical protein